MKDTMTNQSQVLMGQDFFQEELYPLLKKHDKRNMLELSEDKDVMTVTYDRSFSIEIYDYAFLSEVCVVCVVDGKHQTHWHIEYKNAYAELVDCVENPQEYRVDFSKPKQKPKQKPKRNPETWLLVCIILAVACLALSWSGILEYIRDSITLKLVGR